MKEVKVVNSKVSYSLPKVIITDNGYQTVGEEVIYLASGHPKNPDVPRKQGVKVDSLIEMLLINVAEKTNGAMEGISNSEIKAVKDFLVKTVSDINFKQKQEDTK